ncbi:MAG: glycosyltransferase, partial [Verrucomicrobia bacterium]|nr:glycosyltransferase [Verrucomicrobiota bacterium]
MRAQRIVFFVHSLASDWNHGNAHFLRGVVSELLARGHDVRVFEPENAWSRQNLVRDYGETAATDYLKYYPGLRSTLYTALDLDSALIDADLVIVHEWNEPDLISEIGAYHARNRGSILL